MPRGGARAGRQGTAYAQRTDLNNKPRIRPIPGQTYGNVKQQEQVLASVPAPTTRPAPQRLAPPPGAVGAGFKLDAPSARPEEPVTAGLPLGAGPGPEILGAMGQPNTDPSLEVYQQLYDAYPNSDLAGLVEQVGYRSSGGTSDVGRSRAYVDPETRWTDPGLPLVNPPAGVRTPIMAAADASGWTQQDAAELRRLNRGRKNGEVTTRQEDGQWVYVLPNGKTRPTPSSVRGSM